MLSQCPHKKEAGDSKQKGGEESDGKLKQTSMIYTAGFEDEAGRGRDKGRRERQL